MTWLLLVFTPALFAADLWLRVGEARLLPADRSASVRVGSRRVVRAVDADRGVRLIALKPGVTTVLIGDRAYAVRVSAGAEREFTLAMRAEVRRMMGLTFRDDGRPEVGGTLLRFSDWVRLSEVARRYDGEWVFRARPLPDVAERALVHLRRLALDHGFPILRFTVGPEMVAHVPLASRTLGPAVTATFKPFGIRVETSGSDLSLNPLVRTRVILAEVSSSFSREFGIKWPSAYEARLLPTAGEPSIVATLRALEARGEAQILASPVLTCRSGGEARFHAGGEFPIRLASRQLQNVAWKPHGVLLAVKPRADFQGAMSVEIETEISLLDTANSVDGIPAVKKNTVKSHFDLPGRRTIALSGLLREEMGSAREGLPLLGSLPILGPLFSSRNFQNRRSELVVFVTPEVYSPETDEKIELPAGWVPHEQ